MSIRVKFKLQREQFKLDVDLNLSSSGITAIYGPSGCGKTTLLRLISGLEYDPGGIISINNHVWQNKVVNIPTHKRSIAYVFQESSLFNHLSVADNIRYGMRRTKSLAHAEVPHQLLDLLDLRPLLNRSTSTLSGGERQRVAIARALAPNPSLLLLDEPLAAVDTDRKREILPYLQNLHTELEIPVIYVTHALDEAARLADYLLLMDQGRIIAEGAISEMLMREELPFYQHPNAYSLREDGPSALIMGEVSALDDQYQLCLVAFPDGIFTLPNTHLSPGNKIRLQIAARDVSLVLERPENTSILNVFACTIVELRPYGPAQIIVSLQLGTSRLLALISLKSADHLSLNPGMEVFALIKSVALLN